MKKDLLASVPKKARPYLLLVLALIPILAVWAVYDDVVRRQSAEILRLRQQAPAAGETAAPGPPQEAAPAPPRRSRRRRPRPGARSRAPTRNSR